MWADVNETPEATRVGTDGRRTVLRVLAVVVPLVALFVWGASAFFRAGPRDVGNPAPSFELEPLDGRGKLRSADLRGKPYVLNFWASWCLPCREEARVLAKVAGRGLGTPRFMGVNILDARGEALAFVRKFEIRYDNFRDGARSFRRFGVTGMPETLFVSADGRLVGRYVGALDERTLRDLMSDLVRLRPGDVLEISGRGVSVGVP